MADFTIRLAASQKQILRWTVTAWPLAVLLWSSCAGPPRTAVQNEEFGRRPSTVLLISLDGYRWDYPDRYALPNLTTLAEEGVRADRLVPVFPTTTFPNHYTIVTGLYPVNHGIVSNTMYDPERDAHFRMSDREAVTDPAWWHGEPIWVTAEKQGLVTASYFWVGSEVLIDGTRPTYWKEFDQTVPPADRVNEVLRWLTLPEDERPALISLYFGHVDRAAHRYGADDPRTVKVIRALDAHIGDLLDGLRALTLLDDVNVIVVSDHGLVDRSPDRVIFLDDYLDPDDAKVTEWSPMLALHPGHLSTESLYKRLAGAHPRLKIYRAAGLPDRLRYSGNPRIAPVIGIVDEGWSIGRRDRFEARYFEGATHGYDNVLPSMKGIFIARGPAFQRGVRVNELENIHLYAMMADILGVTPAENDGSVAATSAFRSRPPAPSPVPPVPTR